MLNIFFSNKTELLCQAFAERMTTQQAAQHLIAVPNRAAGGYLQSMCSTVGGLVDTLPLIMEKSASECAGGATTVSLFGFSAMTATELQFFYDFSRNNQVNAYILSPCMLFWGDIVADMDAHKFSAAMERQHISPEQLNSYRQLLFDRNPLLANFGALGRKFFSALEAATFTEKRMYALSNAVSDLIKDHAPLYDLTFFEGRGTRLEQVQADLLLLRTPDVPVGATTTHASEDTSIQIHGFSSREAEVNALYTMLQGHFLKHGDAAANVRIMAPNIESYAPYIHAVFGGGPYSFTIISPSIQHTPRTAIGTLLSLLEMPKNQFEKKWLLRVSTSPSIQKRYGTISHDACARLLRKLEYVRGRSAEHAAALMAQAGFVCAASEKGSWDHAEALFAAYDAQNTLAADERHAYQAIAPLFRNLFHDFACTDKRTLTAWIEWLHAFIQTHLVIEGEEQDSVAAAIAKMPSLYNGEQAIEYEQFCAYFETALQECVRARQEKENAVLTFCPIGPTSRPYSVIAFLGMQEGTFVSNASADATSYACIEAVLCARDVLYISYQNISYEDESALLPMPIVMELLRCAHCECPTAGVLLYQRAEPKKSVDWKEAPVPSLQRLDTKKLFFAAKNPLRLYFEEGLGLHITSKFELPGADTFAWWQVKKERRARGYFTDELVCSLPEGQLGEVLRSAIQSDTASMRDALAALDVHNKEGVRIELSTECQEARAIAENLFQVPAVTISGTTITGACLIESADGVILLDRCSKETVLRHYPRILLLQMLYKPFEARVPLLFPKERKRLFVSVPQPHDALARFIAHMKACYALPCGLCPEVAVPLLEGKKIPEIEDDYFAYFLGNTDAEACEQFFYEWQARAKDLFSDVRIDKE